MLATRRVVKALLATWMVVNKASFNRRSLRCSATRRATRRREAGMGTTLLWGKARLVGGAVPAWRSWTEECFSPARTTGALHGCPRGRRQHARAAVCRQPPRTRAVATRRLVGGSRAGRGEKAQGGRRPPLSPATAAPLPCLRRLLRPPEVRSRSGPARTRRVRGSRAWSAGGAGCTSPRCTRRSPSAPRPWWPRCVGRSAPS